MMNWKRWTGCMVAVVLALGTPVLADTESTAGVVAVGGVADARARATLGASATEVLRAAEWQIADTPLPPKEHAGLLHCLEVSTPSGCIPASLTARGIDRALVIGTTEQQGSDGTPTLVLTVRLIVQPDVFSVRQAYCALCTPDKLDEAARKVTQELIDTIAVRGGQTVLDVRSTPEGATITLDGEAIGGTNMKFKTFPGPHVLVLTKPGFVSQTREVTLVQGKTTEVAVTLSAEGATAPPDAGTTTSSRRWGPAALGVTGLLAIAGGAILVAKDEDPVAQPRGTPQRERYLDTATIGAVTMIGGGLVLGAGIVWWRLGGKRTTPVVAPTSGGATVGFSGSF